MAEFGDADPGSEGNNDQTQDDRLYHLFHGFLISFAFIVAAFAFLWPEDHPLALPFLAATLGVLALYEVRIVYRVLQVTIRLAVLTTCVACGSIYLVISPIPAAASIGWLKAANAPTPPNGCDPVSPARRPPGSPVVLLGNSAFIPSNAHSFDAIQSGECMGLHFERGPNGTAISTDIYSRNGRLIGRLRKNVYSSIGSHHLTVERSADLSTLVVHDNKGAELLYVRILNPDAIRVRGIFSCPIPVLSTLTISNSGVSLTGNNLPVAPYPVVRCSVGGATGIDP